MYCPLYPPEGAPLMGFACRECGEVTRTENGMVKHCLYAHGKKVQLELEYGRERPTESIPEQQRGESREEFERDRFGTAGGTDKPKS